VTSDKHAEANRRNALQSTGPKTADGIEAARFNAMRHGLRAIQTVIPGEAPEAWEAHRAGIVEDLKPAGAVELALAEQIAAKLWRLGRAVRHEVDLISIGRDPDELAYVHESAHTFKTAYLRAALGVATREDLEASAYEFRQAKNNLARRDESIRFLEFLATSDPDTDLSWEFAEDLLYALSVDEKAGAKLKQEWEANETGFIVRHAMDLLARKGKPDELVKSLAAFWREDRKDFEKAVRKAAAKYKRTLNRYEAALERLRRARGLPQDAALDKIQRYEAHLERGLHKALERVQALQEVRGACSIKPQAGSRPGGDPARPRGRRNGFVR
jgi:hypothetical protein